LEHLPPKKILFREEFLDYICWGVVINIYVDAATIVGAARDTFAEQLLIVRMKGCFLGRGRVKTSSY
jgi:hypothetical protein